MVTLILNPLQKYGNQLLEVFKKRCEEIISVKNAGRNRMADEYDNLITENKIKKFLKDE